MRKLYVQKLSKDSVRWSYRNEEPDALCVIVQASGRAELKSYSTKLATFHKGKRYALKGLNKFEEWLDKYAKTRDRRP